MGCFSVMSEDMTLPNLSITIFSFCGDEINIIPTLGSFLSFLLTFGGLFP